MKELAKILSSSLPAYLFHRHTVLALDDTTASLKLFLIISYDITLQQAQIKTLSLMCATVSLQIFWNSSGYCFLMIKCHPLMIIAPRMDANFGRMYNLSGL